MGIEQKLEDLYPKHFDVNGEPFLSSEAKNVSVEKTEKPNEKSSTDAKNDTVNWDNKFE